MALNTSFFYFIILWKGHADVMVDGPLGLEGLRPFGPRVAGGWGATPPTRHPRIVCIGHEVKYFHCPS